MRDEDCRAASEVLARVGDKWTALVLVVWTSRRRSQALQRIAQGFGLHFCNACWTLTLRARLKARWARWTRTVFATVPPRVDYELTKLGRSLLLPVSELGLWARKEPFGIIQSARQRYADSRQSH